MSELKCVVFDIDDTLYLERDYVRSGFMRVGEWVQHNLGVSYFFESAWRTFESGTRGSIFDSVLQRCGVDSTPELITLLVHIYRTHDPAIRLCEDAQDCLEGLRGRVALAAVSDGAIESQRAKADALSLKRWMDQVIFTAELGTAFSKPNPRAFELIEEVTAWKGSECVYVADNPIKDFTGPKVLGWRTVRVRRKDGLHAERSSNADVDVEVPDLVDCLRLVD